MQDIKLNQDKGYWDINFSNGDFELTDTIETALFMSVLCEKQAKQSQVANPLLRRGHFSNEFYTKELGSFLWYYTYQHKVDNIVLQNAKKTISDSLQWLINEGFVNSVDIAVSKVNENTIQIEIELKGETSNPQYYNLVVKI
mgnify:CR=1 FL=1